MAELPCVNVLVSRTDEYFRCKSDSISEMLLKYLEDLSSHQDIILYDHVSRDANKLYVSLHQLISNLEPNSRVLWAAVKVFEKLCCDMFFHNALVPNHKFIAPIAELLVTNLTLDQKLCVLRILLVLTKPMDILEREPSLRIITSKLIEYIMTDEMDVVRLSLMALVNICRSNSSVIYNLKSCITGRFFRALMNIQDDRICTKIQMLQLLFLLEPISLAVDGPPDISKTVIDITFSTMVDACNTGELLLLSEIAQFFEELTFLPTYVDFLRNYQRCPEYTENIIQLMRGSDLENVGILLDFIKALLSVNIPALLPLYPQIVEEILPWIENDTVCTKVLRILKIVVLNMENDMLVYNSIINLLDECLPCVVRLYNSAREVSVNGECFIDVLQLFQEIFKFEQMKSKIAQVVKLQHMEDVFDVIPTVYEESKCCKSILLCTSALTLLSSLAQYDMAYLHLHDKLCSSFDIQRILAAGLCEDQTRIQVLKHARALPEDSLAGLARILSGNSSMQIQSMETSTNSTSSFTNNATLNLTKGGHVDELVKDAVQKLDKKEIKSLTVSSVMSLFEYKVAAASHSEQNLYSNLELAQNHCTELQQTIMEMDTRVQQMRELLLKNQQCAEILNVELQELTHIKEVDRVNYKNNVKKYQQDLTDKEKMLRRKQFESESLKDKLKSILESKRNLEINLSAVQDEIAATTSITNEHSVQMCALERKLKETDSFYNDLSEKFELLDEAQEKSKSILTEREAEAANLRKENTSLERDIANLQMLNTAQKNTAKEKDQEIKKLREELSDLKRIRDLIADISSGKKGK
ncbi:Uncharacterized protein GBIM_01376 [Gryllus bimaculatus]|nr:Uncharacterized protein GBIM_01376 [Gryllus bimaculatus]